jgi:hypothetical protein
MLGPTDWPIDWHTTARPQTDRGAAMATITVLNPVPTARTIEANPGPSLASLHGATVGFRTEWIWPAYHVVVHEWQKQLQQRGAKVVVYQADSRLDADHSVPDPGYEAFLDGVDLAVVGLAN